MNAKQVFTALAITFAGSAAFAIEATQYDPAPSTMTRAQVKAELVQARMDGMEPTRGEATEFRAPVVAVRPIDEVRAEARAAARRHEFNELYVG